MTGCPILEGGSGEANAGFCVWKGRESYEADSAEGGFESQCLESSGKWR